MVTIRFLPRAEKDLLALPEDLQTEILNKAELLARFPQMGPPMEKAYSGYRCLLAGKGRYRIVYKPASSTLLEVAYIRHCSRQMTLRAVD